MSEKEKWENDEEERSESKHTKNRRTTLEIFVVYKKRFVFSSVDDVFVLKKVT